MAPSRIGRLLPRFLLVGFLTAALAGCSMLSFFSGEKREEWRDRVEANCLRSGDVKISNWVRRANRISGPGICGVNRPFAVRGALGGSVAYSQVSILACPMVPTLERWLAESVQPAAMHYFGAPVVRVRVAGPSYNCRGRNHSRKGPLSEHSFANAFDVGGFELANGRTVTVLRGWRGQADEQAFLRAAHKGACSRFSTVLGPEADRHHQDHFHFDLARHGRNGTHRVCR